MSMTDFVDYYSLLGVDPSAAATEIEERIKAERKQWRRRQSAADLDARQVAERMMHNLAAAEVVLLDPAKRSAFDQQRLNVPAAGPSAPGDASADNDWVTRAREYLSVGNHSAANYAAKEATSRNSSDDEAWSLVAQTSLAMKNYQEAEFAALEAVRLCPGRPDYKFDLACCYEDMGDLARAAVNFEAAEAADPTNAWYRWAALASRLAMGEFDRAMQSLEQLVDANPTVDEFQETLAVAIARRVETYVTSMKDDSFVLTSAEQVERVRSDMNRIASLRFENSELRAHTQDRLKWAEEAERAIWRRPPSYSILAKVWIAVLLLGLVTVYPYGIGVLILGASGYLYFRLYRMPVWKASAKDLKGTVNVLRWGIGTTES